MQFDFFDELEDQLNQDNIANNEAVVGKQLNFNDAMLQARGSA